MDVLSDVLREMRLTGAVYFDVHAGAPWIATTPGSASICASVMPEFEHVVAFHIMMDGRAWAQLIDEPQSALYLEAGDAVIVPRGHSHSLSSEQGNRAEPDLEHVSAGAARHAAVRVQPVRRPGREGAHHLRFSRLQRTTLQPGARSAAAAAAREAVERGRQPHVRPDARRAGRKPATARGRRNDPVEGQRADVSATPCVSTSTACPRIPRDGSRHCATGT